jgi:predicted lipase
MNWQTAADRVHLCDLSYTDAAKLLGSEHAVIGQQDGETVVAFRGTDSAENWMVDAAFFPRNFPLWPGKIHEGFALAMEGALASLLELLPPKGATVHLAGHSLGAALAILAAWHLKQLGYEVAPLYLFGCPKLGGIIFQAAFDKAFTAYRFVNHNDVVPHLPPRPAPYEHVGELVYFDTQGQAHDSFQADWNVFKLTWDDHHIPKYVGCVERALAQSQQKAAA